MNTKECIEFLTFQKKESGFKESIEKFNKKIDEIIKRLQMWEEFKEGFGNLVLQAEINENATSFSIKKLMSDFEKNWEGKKMEEDIDEKTCPK